MSPGITPGRDAVVQRAADWLLDQGYSVVRVVGPEPFELVAWHDGAVFFVHARADERRPRDTTHGLFAAEAIPAEVGRQIIWFPPGSPRPVEWLILGGRP